MAVKKQTTYIYGTFNLHPDDAVDNVTVTLVSSGSVNSRKIELATGF